MGINTWAGSPNSNAAMHQEQISQAAAAVHDAQKGTDPVNGPLIRAMAQQIGLDHHQADAALRDCIAKYGKEQPYGVADLYAQRKQPDETFDWLQRA